MAIHHIEGTHVCNTSGVYQPPHAVPLKRTSVMARGQAYLANTKRTFPLKSWLVVAAIIALGVGTLLAMAGVKAPQL